MSTGLERIAAKAREETEAPLYQLAHHLTPELWENSVISQRHGARV